MNVDSEDGIDGNIVVSRRSSMAIDRIQHMSGLCDLSNYAKENRHRFRSFLALDSDCFPITEWEQNLSMKMVEYSKDIACIVRPENLDVFAHPAAVYTMNSSLLNFGLVETTNLLGDRVVDSGCRISSFFPMLRTNRLNLHPLSFGVYYNMFYHHGAGSRRMTSRSDRYYDIECEPHGEFFDDPEGFIRKLI
jgi:hypothetical protein